LGAAERARLIQRYRDGYAKVAESLEGATEDEMDEAPAGEWTPRMVVHHLADAEMIGAERLRRLLAEANPRIQGYDEEAFAETLTKDRPVEPSVEAIRWARETTLQVLERMSEDDWKRAGVHDERGRFTAEDWLAMYAPHAHDHAEQINRMRRR
jgi:hypothetical protein